MCTDFSVHMGLPHNEIPVGMSGEYHILHVSNITYYKSEYEELWFPAGTPCELAVARTKPGSVVRVDDESASMQSFSADQLYADARGVPPPTSPSKRY